MSTRPKFNVWRRWYAWHPVRVNTGTWVFMEDVMRMRVPGVLINEYRYEEILSPGGLWLRSPEALAIIKKQADDVIIGGVK